MAIKEIDKHEAMLKDCRDEKFQGTHPYAPLPAGFVQQNAKRLPASFHQ